MNNKKLFPVIGLGLALILSLSGCSKAPYDFDLAEYVTVGNYTGVEVSAAEIEEEMDAQIQQILENNTVETEITDRAIQLGDVVNIDYVGTLDGVAFDNGSGTGVELEIGSGVYVDGFEDSLIGANIGETVTANCTFPEDYEYNEELAGQETQFEITINSAKTVEVPELTDAFLAEHYSDYANVDAFKTELHDLVYENKVWNTILDSTTVVQYPDEYVKKYYEQMISYYENSALTNGYTLATLLSASGQTMDSFLTEAAEYAKSQVKQELVMYTIARANDIEVTNADYDAKAPEYAEEYGYESVKAMEQAIDKELLKQNILMEKVVEFVVANAVDVD